VQHRLCKALKAANQRVFFSDKPSFPMYCLFRFRLRLILDGNRGFKQKEFLRLSRNRKHKASQSLHFTVKEATTLLPFLLEVMPNRGRNSVKSILRRGQVSVDDHIETKYNYELYVGQQVSILKNKAAVKEGALIGLSILYEDADLIVVNKEAGLLSIATQKEKRRTAHHQLMIYVRKEHPRNRVFVVHRLDRETSGVMVFAKSAVAKRKLQDSWRNSVKERRYLALAEGKVQKQSGTVASWLKETKSHRMYSSFAKDDGLFARTHYKVLQSNANFSLVEVHLDTGRKNQIRVHMQDLGHPVVGDKKYGSRSNAIRRLGLHAHILSFTHPTTEEVLTFKSPAPKVYWTKSR